MDRNSKNIRDVNFMKLRQVDVSLLRSNSALEPTLVTIRGLRRNIVAARLNLNSYKAEKINKVRE